MNPTTKPKTPIVIQIHPASSFRENEPDPDSPRPSPPPSPRYIPETHNNRMKCIVCTFGCLFLTVLFSALIISLLFVYVTGTIRSTYTPAVCDYSNPSDAHPFVRGGICHNAVYGPLNCTTSNDQRDEFKGHVAIPFTLLFPDLRYMDCLSSAAVSLDSSLRVYCNTDNSCAIRTPVDDQFSTFTIMFILITVFLICGILMGMIHH